MHQDISLWIRKLPCFCRQWLERLVIEMCRSDFNTQGIQSLGISIRYYMQLIFWFLNTSNFLLRPKHVLVSQATRSSIPILMIVLAHWMAHTLQQRYPMKTQQHIEIEKAGYLKMYLHIASLTIHYLCIY